MPLDNAENTETCTISSDSLVTGQAINLTNSSKRFVFVDSQGNLRFENYPASKVEEKKKMLKEYMAQNTDRLL